jgi:protein-tyrosine-phosphatase
MSIIRICFVCSGNICRSPLAEGVFKHQVELAGLAGDFHIESFGIGSWHVGEAPDPRAQQTARRHGLRLTGRAQQFKPRDFERFDLIVALDSEVAEYLRRLAPTPPAGAGGTGRRRTWTCPTLTTAAPRALRRPTRLSNAPGAHCLPTCARPRHETNRHGARASAALP